MRGPCDGCKQVVPGPAISWKFSLPTPHPSGTSMQFKKHRYCVKCAAKYGIISPAEVKEVTDRAKTLAEMERKFLAAGWGGI